MLLYGLLQNFGHYVTAVVELQTLTDGRTSLVILAYAFFLSGFNVLLAGVRAQSKNLFYSVSFAMPGVLFFIFLVIVIGFTEPRLKNVVLILNLSCMVSFGALVIYFYPELVRSKFPRIAVLKDIVGYGVKNYLTRILSTGLQVAPFVVLAVLEHEEALGYYAAAMIAASLFRLMGQSLSLFLTAKLSDQAEADSLRFVFVLSLLMAVGFAVLIPIISKFSDELMVFVYGADFLPAGVLVSWLMIAVSCEILIGVILRPFITRDVPLHFVQWLVYGSALLALLVALKSINFVEVNLFLPGLGRSLVLANGIGLILSIFAFWFLASYRESNTD